MSEHTQMSNPLLDELEMAHRIIQNALNIMTVKQRNRWADANRRDRVDGEGATRANERLALISAAPKLLEAAKSIKACFAWPSDYGEDTEEGKAMRMVYDAIDKAKGETL